MRIGSKRRFSRTNIARAHSINIDSPILGKQIIALTITILLCWPLGLDQLFPPLLFLFYILIRKIFTNEEFYFNIYYDIFIIIPFIAIVIASGTSIVEETRTITFIRDFMIWVTGFAFFIHFYGSSRGRSIFNRHIGNAIVILYLIIILSCVIYVIYPFSFRSVAYFLVPESISSTMLGGRVLIKTLGDQLYFYGFTDRVRSFFAAPIHLSCVITILFPFFLKRFDNAIWTIFAYFVTFLVLFYAQARLALVCFAAFPLIKLGISLSLPRRTSSVHVALGSAIMVIVFAILVLYADQVADFLHELFIERRRGSAEVRESIYLQTWSWFLERPWLGYGTQRDVPGLTLPLGSHSALLGVMFKHGIFAAALILMLLIAPAYRLALALRNAVSKEQVDFLSAILTGYLCYLILIMVNEFIVDAYHTILLMVMIAIYSGTTRQQEAREPQASRYRARSATRSRRSLSGSA